MSIRPSLLRLSPVLLALLLSAGDRPLRADPVVLVDEDFDSDVSGAGAKPTGDPSVQGEVYEDSTTLAGCSLVVVEGSLRRYRIGNLSAPGETRGIRFPFSGPASGGTVQVRAVVAAEQTDAGAGLSCSDPEEHEWPCSVRFGPDGTFAVHGQATAVPYAAGTSYEIGMTLHPGTEPTVDYSVRDLGEDTVVYTGSFAGAPGAAPAFLRFAAEGPAEGAFTIDDVLVTR